MNFGSFFADVCAAFLSGILLTFTFFLIREFWHPVPKLSGRWYFETHTHTSSSKRYEDLCLKYEAMVAQNGQSLIGTTEKIFESNSKESFEYVNEKRSLGDLQGYIDRFYLRKNRISLHLIEHGRLRKSSAVFDLEMEKGELMGKFCSTAASASGKSVWSKDRHSKNFSSKVRFEKGTTTDFGTVGEIR